MASKKKPLTDEQKLEIEVQADKELLRLQRMYQILAKDRSYARVTKQQKVIDILQREMTNLEVDLKVATGPSKVKGDLALSRSIIELLDEYDCLCAAVKLKKHQLHEVNDNIKEMNKVRCNLKAQQVSDLKMMERSLKAQQTLGTLENKLEVQVKKNCAILFLNSILREDIEHLLEERADFNKAWEKFINHLCTGKKYMLDLIEQASIAYDQREEWCAKLQALRVKAKNDFVRDAIDMSELTRRNDDNTKVVDFYTIKNQKRIMVDLERTEMSKRNLKRKKIENSVKQYKKIMDDIYVFTGITEIDKIVKKFASDESENFALFKYINDLNLEMEDLNDKLESLHNDIDEQKALNELRTNQQQATLEKLTSEWKAAYNEADQAEVELARISENVDNVMAGIQELFDLCECKNDPMLKLIGDQSQITVYNGVLYTHILEGQVQEKLVKVYHKEKYLTAKKALLNEDRLLIAQRGKPSIYTIDQIAPSNPCPLCVEHEQVSDVIDKLQKILSREQIQNKVKAALEMPDGLQRTIHHVAHCSLPKSREIIQLTYQ